MWERRFFILLRAWDKETILSPYEESSPRPSGSALRCSNPWATETPRWARSITNFVWHASCILLDYVCIIWDKLRNIATRSKKQQNIGYVVRRRCSFDSFHFGWIRFDSFSETAWPKIQTCRTPNSHLLRLSLRLYLRHRLKKCAGPLSELGHGLAINYYVIEWNADTLDAKQNFVHHPMKGLARVA